ncbi:MAG: TcpQ domain-containing protein [Micavibrio aeruginosavorus]|uniref:TcpQ domain-containing protein n=1 Tax=Micavibrio aeruginosavorus TaxID=349221 RepID=A0A7T5R2N7_9BACT|nr:MAG: TcpQ domain-containing protein [Micavibrio aeruginosavorus]
MSGKSALWRQTALTALMMGVFSLPAQAGFEWTPPPAAPVLSTASTDGPPVPAAPSGNVEATELTPALPESENPAVSDMAAPPVLETENADGPPPAFPEALPAPMAYENALGFGADIPLALALGQIVPPAFAYSFASDVHPGVKISWEGGKPWNQVLEEALAPHDLTSVIEGTIVTVRRAEERKEVKNDLAVPAEKASYDAQNEPLPPVDTSVTDDALPVSDPVMGEGTANNYPRRTPPHRRSLHNEVPADTAAGSAPLPPVTNEQAVIVEQPPKEMAEANQVASYEPAAPAQDIGIVEDSAAQQGPQPLEPQKISYADEGRASHEDLIPPRGAPENNDSYASTGHVVLDPFEIRFWQAKRDQNLRDVLMSWAGNAGVEVIWDSGYDYKLPHAISMHGTFPEAVTKIFSLYGDTEPRPQGRLHPNLPKGPSVLLVENFP